MSRLRPSVSFVTQESSTRITPRSSAAITVTRTRSLRTVPAGWPVRCARAVSKPGDRVAFLSPNCHRLLEAYYGVLEAGAALLAVEYPSRTRRTRLHPERRRSPSAVSG